MLDNSVPNPLAKSPNVNTTKVFAAIGLISVLVLIMASGIWYFSAGRFSTSQDENVINQPAPLPDKVEFIPRRIATASSKPLDTTGWKEYKKKTYSFKYPADFSIASDYGDGVRLASSDLSPKTTGPVEKITAGTELEISSYTTAGGTQPTSLEEWDKIVAILARSSMEVAGVKAIRAVEYDPYNHRNMIGIVFFKNKVIYRIYQYFPVTANDIDSSIIDAVAASFKFL